MLDRTARAKKWLAEKSKTKGAQWISSIGIGAGWASGVHSLISTGLLLTPTSEPTLNYLKIANYILSSLIFMASTAIVYRGQNRTTHQLNEDLRSLMTENGTLQQENLELKKQVKDIQIEQNESLNWLRQLSLHTGFSSREFLEKKAQLDGYVLILNDEDEEADASPLEMKSDSNFPEKLSIPRSYSFIHNASKNNTKETWAIEIHEPLLGMKK